MILRLADQEHNENSQKYAGVKTGCIECTNHLLCDLKTYVGTMSVAPLLTCNYTSQGFLFHFHSSSPSMCWLHAAQQYRIGVQQDLLQSSVWLHILCRAL